MQPARRHGVDRCGPARRGPSATHREMMNNRLLIRGLLLPLAVLSLPALLPLPARAQPKSPASWTARLLPADARAGEGAQLVIEAKIEAPWHLYSLTKPKDLGPVPTSITLVPGKALRAAGEPVQPAPHAAEDPGFGIKTESYEGGVAFGLPVSVAPGAAGKRQAVVKVRFQVCNERLCMPPRTLELPIAFTVAAGPARADRAAAVTTVPPQPAGYKAPDPSEAARQPASATTAGPVSSTGAAGAGAAGALASAQQGDLGRFLWLSLLAGFLALLTPCVFPMVPITVSFFSKQKEQDPSAAVRGAFAYCLGIIGTFTGLGLLVTLVFGASGVSNLATNPWINLGLAALFVVLAVNLFGGFEIILPGWLLEKTQGRGGGSKFLGPLLMGFTFTLTSFTCTVPFVGTLLASTTQGNWLWPVTGMLAFSTAFASPFFLLALFPGWLARMPKSGGWLVTVKAYMGFVELAAALKFLSNADLVFNWGFLTRPVFLAVWAGLAGVAACYMQGWLQLPHQGGAVAIGPTRRLIGAATAVMAAWCFGAINGGSLGEFNAFLPPATYGARGAHVAAGGIEWLEDWDAAVARAKAENKPLFINFTGVTCTNCRLMEANIFPHPDVVAAAKQFVAVELFTDKSDARSAGYKQLEQDKFGTVALPLYAVMTADGKILGRFEGLTRDPGEFVAFLQKGHADALMAKSE